MAGWTVAETPECVLADLLKQALAADRSLGGRTAPVQLQPTNSIGFGQSSLRVDERLVARKGDCRLVLSPCRGRARWLVPRTTRVEVASGPGRLWVGFDGPDLGERLSVSTEPGARLGLYIDLAPEHRRTIDRVRTRRWEAGEADERPYLDGIDPGEEAGPFGGSFWHLPLEWLKGLERRTPVEGRMPPAFWLSAAWTDSDAEEAAAILRGHILVNVAAYEDLVHVVYDLSAVVRDGSATVQIPRCEAIDGAVGLLVRRVRDRTGLEYLDAREACGGPWPTYRLGPPADPSALACLTLDRPFPRNLVIEADYYPLDDPEPVFGPGHYLDPERSGTVASGKLLWPLRPGLAVLEDEAAWRVFRREWYGASSAITPQAARVAIVDCPMFGIGTVVDEGGIRFQEQDGRLPGRGGRLGYTEITIPLRPGHTLTERDQCCVSEWLRRQIGERSATNDRFIVRFREETGQ